MAIDKEAHARRQREHYANKMTTHTRVCVWVPHALAGEFKRKAAALAKRLEQKT
jgi:hypothetical protein